MKSIAAIVAGTSYEGRAAVIRSYCHEGASCELKREPTNPHDPNAIAVWMRCRVFGFVPMARMIGYIKADRASTLARRMDAGEIVVERVFVRSYYAPIGRDYPRVSLAIEVIERSTKSTAPPATAVAAQQPKSGLSYSLGRRIGRLFR